MTSTLPLNVVSFDAARRVLDAAIDHAGRLGRQVCIAVADPTGEPIVTARMDRAPRLSAQLAANKAWTVASFGGMPTHAWWPAISDDPALVHGLTQTPRLVIFGGGVPILVGGEVVGAIGVSGGSAEEDREIAEAGAGAVEG